ncbi:MAG: SGNH/GDSL hydrolase family protein [Ginsengibacter sp.]
MRLRFFTALLFIVSFQFSFSQNTIEYKTWNPANDTLQVLEGQAWPREVKDFYDRLPAKAEQSVRKEVWNLSKNSAGLQMRFQTNASEIIIKYQVTGSLQMPHMPATGVSGVDLYSKTIDGNWLWAAGRYSFGDTITYHFKNLLPNDQHVNNREYTLYLPLYNSVKWMEISVPKEAMFKPLALRTDKPIVVYGTSIAQGGCASRPGLAWTNILGRKLDRPVINLAFSGNGRLEKEMIDLLTEVDAKMYVLDCLPNLTSPDYYATGELKKRISASVIALQGKKPYTPILLTDHDGYTDEEINPVRKNEYVSTNKVFNETFDSLLEAGVKNIFRLFKEAINQDIESTVDGTHPNDIGMMHYAEAYEKKIKTILGEPEGIISTTIPVTQRRDAKIYDWETRHSQVIQYDKIHPPKLALIGNSITHYWSGPPVDPRHAGTDSWEKYFTPRITTNMGFGWDRIENILWRIYHGELDSISPKQIVLMIGTNNLGLNTNDEIATGLQFLIKAIRSKQPKAGILLMGIFPRRDMEERIVALNKLIANVAVQAKVTYADAGNLFIKKDGKIDEALFSDGLHPNAVGYEKLGEFIIGHLDRMK